MILIRYILVGLIIYLIIRVFIRFWEKEAPSLHKSEPHNNSKPVSKKISKEIGEYVDYEEVDK